MYVVQISTTHRIDGKLIHRYKTTIPAISYIDAQSIKEALNKTNDFDSVERQCTICIMVFLGHGGRVPVSIDELPHLVDSLTQAKLNVEADVDREFVPSKLSLNERLRRSKAGIADNTN